MKQLFSLLFFVATIVSIQGASLSQSFSVTATDSISLSNSFTGTITNTGSGTGTFSSSVTVTTTSSVTVSNTATFSGTGSSSITGTLSQTSSYTYTGTMTNSNSMTKSGPVATNVKRTNTNSANSIDLEFENPSSIYYDYFILVLYQDGSIIISVTVTETRYTFIGLTASTVYIVTIQGVSHGISGAIVQLTIATATVSPKVDSTVGLHAITYTYDKVKNEITFYWLYGTGVVVDQIYVTFFDCKGAQRNEKVFKRKIPLPPASVGSKQFTHSFGTRNLQICEVRFAVVYQDNEIKRDPIVLAVNLKSN